MSDFLLYFYFTEGHYKNNIRNVELFILYIWIINVEVNF